MDGGLLYDDEEDRRLRPWLYQDENPVYGPQPDASNTRLLRKNLLDADNPEPSQDSVASDVGTDTAGAPPEEPPKIEPPDYSRRDKLRQRIDDILNTPKAPFLEMNRGRYQELASLSGLLGEEDRSANNEYARKLQEQTMYGKNLTNQQRVEAQRYGYDQKLAGLLGAAGTRADASMYGANQRLAGQRYGADARANRPFNVPAGGSVYDPATGETGPQTGFKPPAPARTFAPPRRTASAGADNSAIPKLPASTQKIVNAIVTDQTLTDQEKGNQLDQVLNPLGLAWSRLQKTIVRKPTMGAGGGVKGTVPAAGAAAPTLVNNDPLGIR